MADEQRPEDEIPSDDSPESEIGVEKIERLTPEEAEQEGKEMLLGAPPAPEPLPEAPPSQAAGPAELPSEPLIAPDEPKIESPPPDLAELEPTPKATVGFDFPKDLLKPIGPPAPAHLVEPPPTLGMQPIPPPEPEGEPPRKPPSRPSGPAIERPEYLPELAPGEAELAVIGPDMPEQEWLEPLPQPAGPIRQEPPPQPAQPEAKGEDLAAGKPAPAAAGEGAGAVTETNTLLRELISAIERVTEQVTEAVIELKAIHDAMGETDTGPTRF